MPCPYFTPYAIPSPHPGRRRVGVDLPGDPQREVGNQVAPPKRAILV